MVVPESSVREKDGTSVVFLIRDDTAIELPVNTGKKIGSYVEIVSGLELGDKVIENLTDKIQNGIKVSIK
jgi:multidrug efflux pump subunit AcrA (membrane-fusion protein)